jgi:hypothetical protein
VQQRVVRPKASFIGAERRGAAREAAGMGEARRSVAVGLDDL